METYGIQPNTTQIPHLIIREWLPRLKDVELRVLLIVADQTLGWIEDQATGRRKEKDWISHYQLQQKTGRSERAISSAVKVLVEKHGIIQAYNEGGFELNKAEERRKEGFRIYYRLNLKHPPQSLFGGTIAKFAMVGHKVGKTEKKLGKKEQPMQNLHTQNLHTTKETVLTKEIITAAKLPTKEKPKSDHKQFIEFWHEEVQRARGMKPIITGQDAKNLKRILDAGVSRPALEQAAIYFLNAYTFKTFSPSVSTLVSAGILNGILSRMKNDERFWKDLEGYLANRGRKPTEIKTNDRAELEARIKALRDVAFRFPAGSEKLRQ